MKSTGKLHFIALFLMVLYLLPACRKTDWQELPPAQRSRLDGVWVSEGYGYLLDIRNGKAKCYHITKDYGVPATVFFDGASEDISTWDVAVTEKDKAFRYRSKNLITEFRFNRINKLPRILEAGGIAPSQDPQLNFDVLWQSFDEHYAFFRQRGIDWDAVRRKYRPLVNEGNLESVTREVLGLFNEDHVTLTTTTDDFLNRFDAGIFRTLRSFAQELPAGTSQTELKLYALGEYEKIVGNILGGYVTGFKTALQNQLIWGSLDAQTGYLMVGQMQGYELADLKTALDEVLPDLASYNQLVIDLRGNLGGSDRVVLELAGRFISQPVVGWRFNARDGNKLTPLQTVMIQPTGTVRFTRPIRILTSIATSSAAEVFTLALKQLPYVRSVGEATNGIFSTLLNKKLPNGWTFSLSNEVLTNAAGRNYEGIGIPVDTEAPFPTAAYRNKGVDPALDQYPSWF